MERFDSIEPMRLIILLMKATGMWTFKQYYPIWTEIYQFYRILLHGIFFCMLVLGMFINVGFTSSLDELSDSLYMSLCEIAFMVKDYVLLTNIKTTVHIMEIFETYKEGLPKNKEEQKIISHVHNGFRLLRNLFMTGTCTILCISITAAFLDKNYRLPFSCWIPFDYKNENNYYYAYSYVAIGMVTTAICNVNLDLYQAYLLLHLSIYYKLLGYRWEKYGNDIDIEHKSLKEQFRFHAFITRTTAECERLLSKPVLVQILLSAFVLCFTVYKLQNVSFLNNPSMFFQLLCFGCVMALQIYLPCKYGNELTFSAYELTNSVYSCNWLDLSPKVREDLFIYMEFLKQPVVVRAGKYFKIGFGVFTQTMNNAYRIFALLLNFNK